MFKLIVVEFTWLATFIYNDLFAMLFCWFSQSFDDHRYMKCLHTSMNNVNVSSSFVFAKRYVFIWCDILSRKIKLWIRYVIFSFIIKVSFDHHCMILILIMLKVRFFHMYFFSSFVIFLVYDKKFVNIFFENCKKKHDKSLNQFIELLSIMLFITFSRLEIVYLKYANREFVFLLILSFALISRRRVEFFYDFSLCWHLIW